MVTPPESAWFQSESAHSRKVKPLESSAFYKEDFIGLRQLDEAGKVDWVSIHADHSGWSEHDLDKYFIPFLLQ